MSDDKIKDVVKRSFGLNKGKPGKGGPRLPKTQASDVVEKGTAPNFTIREKKHKTVQTDRLESAFREGARVKKQSGTEVRADNRGGLSDLNEISKGNKSKTHDVDLSIDKDNQLRLQYQMPKKLEKIFKDNPEKIKKLSKYIQAQLTGAEDDRQEFMEERLPKFRDQLLNFISAGLEEIFEGQHNVHVPLAFEKCKAMHARVFQAILGVDPIFSLKARFSATQPQKDAKEQLLNYVIKNYANFYKGIYETIDRDIWNFCGDGTAVTKHWWKKDVRKYTEVDEETQDDGTIKEKEVEAEEVIFDGPMLSTVPLEDFYMAGDCMEDADSFDLIAERQRMSKSDLVAKTKLGFFIQDQVEYILETVSPSRNDLSAKGSQDANRNVKEHISGVKQIHKQSGRKLFTVFEAYARFDIDDDGIDEELVVWLERTTGRVIRLTFLERVGPGGRRPFVIKRFFTREDSPYGIGLGEMLFGLNNEVDYIHNLRLDSAVFNVLPMFVYKKTGNIGPQKQEIRASPGKGLGLEDINDFAFVTPKTNLNFTYQEEQNINRVADGVSSISNISSGQVSGSQGATRTATGTAAIVAAADALLDISIKRYQFGFKRNLEILDKQITELLPLGTPIEIMGADGIPVVKYYKDRKAQRFDVAFELEANSATSNKAVEREVSQIVYQNSLNPILIQTGVVGPEQIKNAYVDYLKANDRKNVSRYVQNVQESIFPTRSGKDELTMILMGIRPEVNIQDKHDEKLRLFEEFEQAEDGIGLLTTDLQLQLYSETKQAHQKFAQAMAAQAAQTAQSGITAPQQTAGIAAGAGNPSGAVPNQIEDLMGGLAQ